MIKTLMFCTDPQITTLQPTNQTHTHTLERTAHAQIARYARRLSRCVCVCCCWDEFVTYTHSRTHAHAHTRTRKIQRQRRTLAFLALLDWCGWWGGHPIDIVHVQQQSCPPHSHTHTLACGDEMCDMWLKCQRAKIRTKIQYTWRGGGCFGVVCVCMRSREMSSDAGWRRAAHQQRAAPHRTRPPDGTHTQTHKPRWMDGREMKTNHRERAPIARMTAAERQRVALQLSGLVVT